MMFRIIFNDGITYSSSELKLCHRNELLYWTDDIYMNYKLRRLTTSHHLCNCMHGLSSSWDIRIAGLVARCIRGTMCTIPYK